MLGLATLVASSAGLPGCEASPVEPGAIVGSAITTSLSYGSPLAFDWGDYLSRYPDLGAAGIDTEAAALDHWRQHGIEEGRQGAPWLDPKDYLSANADLLAAFTDPRIGYASALDHFVAHGIGEHRVGAPYDRLVFDWHAYIGYNQDLSGFDEDRARLHWTTYGIREGRRASHAFWVQDYVKAYPDVPRDYEGAMQHWAFFGAREGRRGASDAPKAKQVGMLYAVWHGLAASAQRYRTCVGFGPTNTASDCAGPAVTVSDIITGHAQIKSARLRDVYVNDQLRTHSGFFYYLNRPLAGFYSMYRKRPNEPAISYSGLRVLDSLDTRTIARQHARQLLAANVDFVYVDLTNLPYRSDVADVLERRPLEVLFEEWHAMRLEGEPTPQIAVFAPAPVAQALKPGEIPPDLLWKDYLDLYNRPEYDDLVARDPYTKKKLFFLVDYAGAVTQTYDEGSAVAIAANGNRHDVLTVRTGWPSGGLETTRLGVTQWMSPCREGSVYGPATSSIASDRPCSQPYTPLPPASGGILTTATFVNASASFHTNGSSRFGGASGANGGLTLKKTFERARSMHPDFLMLTQWNEHLAQPQAFDKESTNDGPIDPEVFAMGLEGDVREPGDDPNVVADGRDYFVDTYAFDYSRDMEPTVENDGRIYDVLRSCMRLYRVGGPVDACAGSGERCCTVSEDERFLNVYSLRRAASRTDYLVTTSLAERSALLGSNAWLELTNRYAGSTDFPQGAPPLEDKSSGPFAIAASAGSDRVALYRCRASDHFLSLSSSCEGQDSDGLVGYVRALPGGSFLRPLLRCIRGQTHLHALAASCPDGARLEQRLGFVR